MNTTLSIFTLARTLLMQSLASSCADQICRLLDREQDEHSQMLANRCKAQICRIAEHAIRLLRGRGDKGISEILECKNSAIETIKDALEGECEGERNAA